MLKISEFSKLSHLTIKALRFYEKEGCAEEQIARVRHNRRRELGRQFKEAAPPLFREYIYAATAAKYGDPLGPTFEMLKEKKTYEQIDDLDNRLTLDGFLKWYRSLE